MNATQILLANLGIGGLIVAAVLVYVRRSLNASVSRVESDAKAQAARQGAEATFDQRLIKQLDERDETLRTEREKHAADMKAEREKHAEELKAKNLELLDVNNRNRDLNDRYYKQMEESMRLSAQATVAAVEHNLAVIKAVGEARAEAHESTKRLHEKFEKQEKELALRDEKLIACEEGHAQCNNRLEAIERLLKIKITAEEPPPPEDDGTPTERMR